MKHPTHLRGFNIVTTMCLVTIFLLLISLTSKEDQGLFYSDQNSGRNENSTPRTFVLPATPAVAVEQEKRASLLEKREHIEVCILKLADLGYDILHTLDDLTNIDITVAVIKFQNEREIEVTGEFDSKTMSKLGCSYQI